MVKRQGNTDRMTFNYGHDIAKTRLSSKLKNNGFDIYEIRKAILNHIEIKALLEKQAIKIGKITGQNFVIGAKSELLSVYRKVNAINKDVTVIQQVNNIVTSVLKGFGFKVVKKDFPEYESEVFYNSRKICELFEYRNNIYKMVTLWYNYYYFHEFIGYVSNYFPELLNLEWEGVEK